MKNTIASTLSGNIVERVENFSASRKTPHLVIDMDTIRDKFKQCRQAMSNARLFYAVKTNPHKRIVEVMDELGANFEVSSEGELRPLLNRGISPQRIISSNPIKSIPFIQEAYEAGVEYFAFDSDDEIDKLEQFAPGSNVYVRLVVSNKGSQWPLERKFGVETEEAVRLLVKASERDLNPCGISFHVGSQCINESSWVDAIRKSRKVWDMARDEGRGLNMLNLGGGFPIEYRTDSIPTCSRIGEEINRTLKEEFPEGVEVFVEPGRAFVGEAGILVATVIAKAKRDGQDWVYLDVGVFNGLMESIGGIDYPIMLNKDTPLGKYVLAGPACDSFDVISNEVVMPEPEIGERVYIPSTGAYTTAYASRFNGFPIPKTYFI